MALGHAPSGNQALSIAFSRTKITQHINSFIASGSDKATGVDDDDICVNGTSDPRMARVGKDSVHALTINRVLWATKGDNMVFHNEGLSIEKRLILNIQGVSNESS